MSPRQIVLLGSPGTRRTVYLEQAAKQYGLPVLVVDWNGWQDRLPGTGVPLWPDTELYMKIDPPLWDSFALDTLEIGRAHV